MLESIHVTFCKSFVSQAFWRQAAVGWCGCYFFEPSSGSTCFSLSWFLRMADRGLQQYSLENVWQVISWLIDHWSIAEKQIWASLRVSSSAYSATGPTATMIPGSSCFCYTDLPHTSCFFTCHSLLQCLKRPPAPLLQPGKARSFFVLCCFLVTLNPALYYFIRVSHHIHSFFE